MNLKDYSAGRMDGLELALKITKQDGIDGLEKEIKFRGQTGIHTALVRKELDKASEKIKAMTLDTFTILTVATLHDEFGFGEKRCRRFIERMNSKAECMVGDMATWQDYIDTITEEMGIELKIRVNG